MSTSGPDQSVSPNAVASTSKLDQTHQSQGAARILAPPSQGSRISGKTTTQTLRTKSTSSLAPRVKAKDIPMPNVRKGLQRVTSLDDWQPGNGFSPSASSKGKRESASKGAHLTLGREKSGSTAGKGLEDASHILSSKFAGANVAHAESTKPEKQEHGDKQQAPYQKQQRRRWTPDSEGDVDMDTMSSMTKFRSTGKRTEPPPPQQPAEHLLPNSTKALYPIPPPPSLLSPTARLKLANTSSHTKFVESEPADSSSTKLPIPLSNPRTPISVKPEPMSSLHSIKESPRTGLKTSSTHSPSVKSLVHFTRRKRTQFARRQPDLLAQLESTDWSQCDPRFLPSLLFRIEYLRMGNPTYNQGARKPFIRANQRAQFKQDPDDKPSWEATCDLKTLLKRFSSEELTAVVWIRDLINGEGEEQQGGNGLVRQKSVRDVRMYLIGREFPFRNLVVVGILVGAEYVTKDTKEAKYRAWHFTVDDSTGVIDVISLEDSARPESYNPPSPIEVGSLVRLTGALEETPYKGRRILADKIEELKDSNLESQHHLTVQALHREIYSQKVELGSLLRNIRQEEKSWAGSQATASEAGTPKKAKPLRKAKRLDPADLQPNFQPYIKHFLRRLFLHPIDLSPQKDPEDCAPYEIIGLRVPIIEIPSEFLLEDFENDSDLHDFAVLLAQKLEKDKRKRRAMKIDAAVKGGGWSAPIGEDDIVNSKPAGWAKGGSAKILPGPTSMRISSKMERSQGSIAAGEIGGNKSIQQQKEDAPLKEGPPLSKAVHQLFRNALIEMRKAGTVVLAIEGEIEALEKQARLAQQKAEHASEVESDAESSHAYPPSPIDSRSPKYDPHRINKTTYNRRSDANSNTYNGQNLDHFYSEPARIAANDGAPWQLICGKSAALPKLKRGRHEEEEEDCDTPKAKKQGKKKAKVARVRGSGEAPWDLVVDTESDEESDIEPKLFDFTPQARKKTSVSDSVTPRGRQVGQAPWDLITKSAADESDDPIVTPRVSKKAPTKVSVPIDSLFANKNPYIRSPSKAKTKQTTEEIQTASLLQIDTESWLLVTPFLLNAPILYIISAEYERLRIVYRTVHDPLGVPEAFVKVMLAQDSRWEWVAENQRMMGKAVEDLVERKLVERLGDLLRPSGSE